MMQVPIKIDGFEGRNLVMSGSGFLTSPKVFMDGQEVPVKNAKVALIDNNGVNIEFKLIYNFIDVIPKIEFEGKTIHLVQALKKHEYFWIGLPLFLILVGGAIGGAIGFIASFSNIRIFRLNQGVKKYVFTGLVSALSFLLFVAVALFINSRIQLQ